MLLRIVEAEAGICDYQGKLLVANVVINRVESGSFPNTVTEVVYQKIRFSRSKAALSILSQYQRKPEWLSMLLWPERIPPAAPCSLPPVSGQTPRT